MTKTFLIVLILLLSFASCSENQQKRSNESGNNNKPNHDTVRNKVDVENKSDEMKDDTSLLILGDSILKLFENRDYIHLSQFIDPVAGLRFSPYGKVDTVKNKTLSVPQLLELAKNKKTIRWGILEGTGDPINLTVNDYFKRFVYDVDFLHPEKKSINKIIGQDSSSSNIKEIYPDAQFVQYYFSGLKKQYEGMDWKSLVLVFKRMNKKMALVSIIHNQWKI